MNQIKKKLQKLKNEQKRTIKCIENTNESQNKQVSFNDDGNTILKERNSTKIFPSIHRQNIYKKINNQKRKEKSSKNNKNTKIKESYKSNKNLEIILNNELFFGDNLNSSLGKINSAFQPRNTDYSSKCSTCVDKYSTKKKKMSINNKDDRMETIDQNNINEKQKVIQSDEKVINSYKKRFIFDNKKKNSIQNLTSTYNFNENRKLSINSNTNFKEIGVKFNNQNNKNKGINKQKLFINLKTTPLPRHQTSKDNLSNSNKIIKKLNVYNNKLTCEKSNNLDDSSKEGNLINSNLKSAKQVTRFSGTQNLNTNENKLDLNLSDKNLNKNPDKKEKNKIKNVFQNDSKDLGIKYKKLNPNLNNELLNHSSNKNTQNPQNKIHNTNTNLNINYYTFNFSNIFQNNSNLNVLDINLILPNKFIIESTKFHSSKKITGKSISSEINTLTPKKNEESNFTKNKMNLKKRAKKPNINIKNNNENNQDNINIIDNDSKISPQITIKNQSNKTIEYFEMSHSNHNPSNKDEYFNILNEENKQGLEKKNFKLKNDNQYQQNSKGPIVHKVLSFESFKNKFLQKRKNTSVPRKDFDKNLFGTDLINNNNMVNSKREKSKYQSNTKLSELNQNILNGELKVIPDKKKEEKSNEKIDNDYYSNNNTLNAKVNSSEKKVNDEYFDLNNKDQYINCNKKYLNNTLNVNKSIKNRIINYKTVNRAVNVKNPIKSSKEVIKHNINNENYEFKHANNSLNLLLEMPKKICNMIFKYFDLKSLNTVCLLNKKYNNCFKKIKNSQIRKFVKKLEKIPKNINQNIIKKSLFKYSDLSKLSQPILQKKYMDLLYEDNFADSDIKKDLTRTYPDNELFKKGNEYYNKLYHLLTVYANYNQNIKYAQGLNFLAANTIYFFEKEIDEFVFLDGLIHKFKLENLLGFSNYLNEKIESLNLYIKKKCPNACKRFDDMGLNYSFFTTNWVVTLFANSMDKNHLSLIWDYMIIYGWKFFNCFIVAVLNLYENEIMKVEQNQLMTLMKNILKNENFYANFTKIIENTFYFINNENNILLY